MADKDHRNQSKVPEPGALRSFLRGVRVTARNPLRGRDVVPAAAAASGVSVFSGLITMMASSPNQWHWNPGTDVGVALTGVPVVAWATVVAAKGSTAAVRALVRAGRQDLRRNGLGE